MPPLHYSDSTGQAKLESVHLLSERDGASVLAALETDTGLKIDRSVKVTHAPMSTGKKISIGVGFLVFLTWFAIASSK